MKTTHRRRPTPIKPIVARCSAWALAWASTAALAQPLDERGALAKVCRDGPAGAIAEAEALRGEAELVAAALLPNPSLVLEHQRSLSGPADHETIAGLAVPIGLGGRYFLGREAAALRQRRAALDGGAARFAAAMALEDALVEAKTERARAAVFAQQQAQLDALSEVIRGLTKGGEAAAYDLLRQEAHAREHRRRWASAAARAEGARARLAAWLGAPIEVPPLTADGALPATATVAGAELASLDAAARAGDVDARAADRRWVPEVELFAGYREVTAGDQTGHGLSLSLSVPITVFDRGQGEAARARAESAAARARRDGLRREREAELAGARVRLAALAAALDPEADARAALLQEKARLLYAAGEATITELLEAFSAAEDVRLGAIEAQAEIAALRVAVMRAAGTTFDPEIDRACGGAEGAHR